MPLSYEKNRPLFVSAYLLWAKCSFYALFALRRRQNIAFHDCFAFGHKKNVAFYDWLHKNLYFWCVFLSAALKGHKKIIKPHIITMRGFVDL
jgi:hypothetical protein